MRGNPLGAGSWGWMKPRRAARVCRAALKSEGRVFWGTGWAGRVASVVSQKARGLFVIWPTSRGGESSGVASAEEAEQ